MKGFERADAGDAWTTNEGDEGVIFPDDFTLDEKVFADELRELFALDADHAPPLYAQTLLDDERLQIPEAGFEQKLTLRVLRRLALSRGPLFEGRWLTLAQGALLEPLQRLRRPVMAGFGAMLMLMALTAAMATPSFAAGVRILLGQTGVEQVNGYPAGVRSLRQQRHASAKQVIDPAMALEWPDPAASALAFAGLDVAAAPAWAKGPLVDLHYAYKTANAGTQMIDIREFQVNDAYSAVLQVVQSGSATLTTFNGMGAVYVDGAWAPRGTGEEIMTDENNSPYVWKGGVRSELIFERNGVIFWMTGDQRYGVGMSDLLGIATMMRPVTARTLQTNRLNLRLAGESLIVTFQPLVGRELYQLVPRGASPESGAGAFVASDD